MTALPAPVITGMSDDAGTALASASHTRGPPHARPGTAAPGRAVADSAPVDPELQQRKARAEQDAKAKAPAEEQRLAGVRAAASGADANQGWNQLARRAPWR